MTKIEWATESWNPITGCTPVSPGCENCYAKRMAKRLRGRYGYPGDDPFKVTLHRDKISDPLGWKKPRTVFVCSMGDLFHEDVPDDFIDQVIAAIALCPQHTFQILTKRQERMFEYFNKFIAADNVPMGLQLRRIGAWMRTKCMYRAQVGAEVEAAELYKRWPLNNLWLGVSCEDQERYDERVPTLLQIPAAVRFVSLEPLLGPIDLGTPWENIGGFPGPGGPYVRGLDWVIIGAESKGGRPGRLCEPNWILDIINLCESTTPEVPVFVKQVHYWPSEGEVYLRKEPDFLPQQYPEGHNG